MSFLESFLELFQYLGNIHALPFTCRKFVNSCDAYPACLPRGPGYPDSHLQLWIIDNHWISLNYSEVRSWHSRIYIIYIHIYIYSHTNQPHKFTEYRIVVGGSWHGKESFWAKSSQWWYVMYLYVQIWSLQPNIWSMNDMDLGLWANIFSNILRSVHMIYLPEMPKLEVSHVAIHVSSENRALDGSGRIRDGLW